MTTLVALLPHVFLGSFAGAIVDRVNRKVVMILADGGTALVLIREVATLDDQEPGGAMLNLFKSKPLLSK